MLFCRGLDLSNYVVNEEHERPVYDLFAVSNHFGGLGGGHCKTTLCCCCCCYLLLCLQILLTVRTRILQNGIHLMTVMFQKQTKIQSA